MRVNYNNYTFFCSLIDKHRKTNRNNAIELVETCLEDLKGIVATLNYEEESPEINHELRLYIENNCWGAEIYKMRVEDEVLNQSALEELLLSVKKVIF